MKSITWTFFRRKYSEDIFITSEYLRHKLEMKTDKSDHIGIKNLALSKRYLKLEKTSHGLENGI